VINAIKRLDRERICFVIAGALTLVAAFGVVWRLRRGIDVTDEAFYLALPLRFALGDHPFVEELNVGQTAGLLIYPLVKLYVHLRGTTGIFLFFRGVYVAFFAVMGLAAYGLARTRLSRHASLLSAAPCLAFIPYAIPGLSYNTLGIGLFGMGLFLTTRSLVAPPEDPPSAAGDPFTWGGFALAAASFAYPSLVVGAALSTASAFLFMSGRRLLSAGRMILGAGVFTLLVVPAFVRAGPSHMRAVAMYSAGGGLTVTTAQLGLLWDQFFGQHPEATTLVMAIGCAIALSRRWPRTVAVGLVFLPLLARGALVGATATSLGYVSSLALVAPLVSLALKDTRAALRIMAGVWVPSAACGAAMGWSSGNGVVASGLGLFPAAIASVIVLSMWIRQLSSSVQSLGVKAAFGFAPALVLSTMMKLVLADDFVYRDGPLPQLTALVTDGPYQGILTTPSRRRTLARTSADIRARASERMLFYYDFPAGYLIAARRPNVPSTWLFAREPRMSMDARQFERDARPGDVIFKLEPLIPSVNPLDRAVSERSEKVADGEGYTVRVVR
jgi:hypothetical protein